MALGVAGKKVCIVSQYVRRSIGSVEVGWRIGSVEAHKEWEGGVESQLCEIKYSGYLTQQREEKGTEGGSGAMIRQ